MASVNTELKIDDDYVNSQAEQITEWTRDFTTRYRQVHCYFKQYFE